MHAIAFQESADARQKGHMSVGKVGRMRGSGAEGDLVIELFGVVELDAVLHGGLMLHTHEVVVPGADVGHHVKAKEAV